jgi:hypothetical protein
MSEPTTTSRFPLVALPALDRLKHFAKDRPAVRLGALFIERLPAILYSLGLLALSVVLAFSRWH